MQPVSCLESNEQDTFSRLPQPKSRTTFSLEKQLACCRDSLAEKRDTGRYQWGRKDGRKATDEKHCGPRGVIAIHQRLDTFPEVYWKMFFAPFLLYKTKERKHVATSFVIHSTCSGKNRPDPLLHFPICTNGRPSAPSQATSAHPAPERQEAKWPDLGAGASPSPCLHLLPLGS